MTFFIVYLFDDDCHLIISYAIYIASYTHYHNMSLRRGLHDVFIGLLTRRWFFILRGL